MYKQPSLSLREQSIPVNRGYSGISAALNDGSQEQTKLIQTSTDAAINLLII